MMTEGRDSRIAHFQVFAYGIVSGDIRLDFVAHAFVDRALSGNGRLAGSFGTSPRFLNRPASAGPHAPHFSRAFPLAEFVTGPFLEFGKISGLFASISLAFGAHFALR
jgi:hypothetical protein